MANALRLPTWPAHERIDSHFPGDSVELDHPKPGILAADCVQDNKRSTLNSADQPPAEPGRGSGKPEGNDVVPMKAFQQGDVYIDYPCEDAKFRYEHATSEVFGRFNNGDEVAVGYTNGVFRDAMRSGAQIDREQYFGD